MIQEKETGINKRWKIREKPLFLSLMRMQVTNEMVITVSKTTDDGNGVVAVDLLLTHLQEITNQVKVGDEGYALLLDGNKKFIAHPTEDAGTVANEEFYNDLYKKEQGTFTYTLDNEDKMMSFITNDLTGWKIAGNLYSAELDEAAAPILQKTITYYHDFHSNRCSIIFLLYLDRS